ncbi:Ropporin-1-like protein [Halocaridina rubra]|uniref:Ropporin-1-like protein n=1 Tax=Halocaridina rubra TaxID=373956 RepID=A0AAN8X7A2_HALRR
MVVSELGEARVPAALPMILKNYTKAAIRTQPKDLLIWSAAYFKAMTNGTVPPVKERLEFPVPESSTGISPGVLRVLHHQLNSGESVKWEDLQEACEGMGVASETAQEAWQKAGGTEGGQVEWNGILTHLAGLSTNSTLEALQMIMTTITDDPISHKVSSAMILEHYDRLQTEGTSPSPNYTEAVDYLNDIANYQEGFLVPSDLTRPSCPPIH